MAQEDNELPIRPRTRRHERRRHFFKTIEPLRDEAGAAAMPVLRRALLVESKVLAVVLGDLRKAVVELRLCYQIEVLPVVLLHFPFRDFLV